jgi:ABC-type transport system involved in multi-copper enzyme maturation permease subunit
MTTTTHGVGRVHPSWVTRFWAVVKYEMLWNIRKKKFLGVFLLVFVLATVQLALPAIFHLPQNPDAVVGFTVGNLGFFLFALVVAMNSISGEFESGTIVPLITKPVSRTMVFLGKLFAAFIIILATYTVFFVYLSIGGIIVYGPQNNLQLVPLDLLGNIISTFIWVAIVLAVGSLSKSSLIAAIGSLCLFGALFIAAPIVSLYSNQPGVLNYLPGGGATGTLNIAQRSQNITILNMTISTSASVSTGTDNIGANLVNYVLHPSANVNITKEALTRGAPRQPSQILYTTLYTESIAFILLRSIAVASTYILVFSLIAWYALKRAQITE